MNKKARLGWLDELRGLAALAVVLFHYLTNYDKHYGHSFSVPDFFSFGYLGVPLFFMISGFVIFMTVSNSKNIVDFAISRFSRLFPVFWVAVTITYVWVIFLGPVDRSVGFNEYVINLSMLHEYVGVPHVDRVYWTLSIELMFYFWMSVLLISKNLKWVCLIFSILIIAGLLQQFIPEVVRQVFILKYIAFFSAGVAFFKVANDGVKVQYVLLILLSLLYVYMYYSLFESIIITVIYGYFSLRMFVSWAPNRVFLYMGSISYSLYLVHQNIGYSIIQTGYQNGLDPLLSISVALLFSVLLAGILRRFVEVPGQRAVRNGLHRLINSRSLLLS